MRVQQGGSDNTTVRCGGSRRQNSARGQVHSSRGCRCNITMGGEEGNGKSVRATMQEDGRTMVEEGERAIGRDLESSEF